jgi:hypothetical protein
LIHNLHQPENRYSDDPKQIDRYLIQSEISRGGMATVYLLTIRASAGTAVKRPVPGNPPSALCARRR